MNLMVSIEKLLLYGRGYIRLITATFATSFLISCVMNSDYTRMEDSIDWESSIQIAKDEFSESGQDIDCFLIETYEEDQSHFVSIHPKENEIEPSPDLDEDEFMVYSGSTSSACGYEINYEFSGSGSLIRKFYSR